MAIGLVLLAGVIALPVAVCAWLLGFVSFGNAFLIYILTGWAVVAAGFLSALLGYLANGAGAGNEGETRAVSLKVKPANRG